MNINTQVQYWMAFLALAIAAGALLAIERIWRWAARRNDALIPYGEHIGGEFAQIEQHNQAREKLRATQRG